MCRVWELSPFEVAKLGFGPQPSWDKWDRITGLTLLVTCTGGGVLSHPTDPKVPGGTDGAWVPGGSSHTEPDEVRLEPYRGSKIRWCQ